MNKEEALYNPDAGAMIKEALKAKKISQIKLADDLAISTKQIQNYQKGYFPKFNTKNIQKLDKILGTSVYAAIYQSEHKSEEKVLNGGTKSSGLPSEEPTAMQLMKIIVETNESIRKDHSDLIALHKQIVETNAKLADSNNELARKIPQPTAGAAAGTQLDVQTILGKVLGFVAQVGAGKRYKSPQEALAVLNSEIAAPQNQDILSGIQSSGHK